MSTGRPVHECIDGRDGLNPQLCRQPLIDVGVVFYQADLAARGGYCSLEFRSECPAGPAPGRREIGNYRTIIAGLNHVPDKGLFVTLPDRPATFRLVDSQHEPAPYTAWFQIVTPAGNANLAAAPALPGIEKYGRSEPDRHRLAPLVPALHKLKVASTGT